MIIQKIRDLIKDITTQMLLDLQSEEQNQINYNVLVYYDIKNSYMLIGKYFQKIMEEHLKIQKQKQKLINNSFEKNQKEVQLELEKLKLIKRFVQQFDSFLDLKKAVEEKEMLKQLKYQDLIEYERVIDVQYGVDLILEVVDLIFQ